MESGQYELCLQVLESDALEIADIILMYRNLITEKGTTPRSKHRFSSVPASGLFLLSFIRKKCQKNELRIIRARPPPSQIDFPFKSDKRGVNNERQRKILYCIEW